MKTLPHSCEGIFFALSSSKTTSGSCRHRKYSIGRNKNLCAKRSSFPGSWLLPKTLRTNILQCFFSAGSKFPFSQLFHHSCNRILLHCFLGQIKFQTQIYTYTWEHILLSLKVTSSGTSCVFLCYNISLWCKCTDLSDTCSYHSIYHYSVCSFWLHAKKGCLLACTIWTNICGKVLVME